MAQRVITPQEVELAMLLGRSQRESGSDYLWAEALPDGRWIYLLPLFQGYRLGVSRDRADQTFQDIYDFPMSEAAWRAVVGWDGEGDPEGWVRHCHENQIPRRRPDGTPQSEYRAP